MPYSMKVISEAFDFLRMFDGQLDTMSELYPEDYYRYMSAFHPTIKDLIK